MTYLHVPNHCGRGHDLSGGREGAVRGQVLRSARRCFRRRHQRKQSRGACRDSPGTRPVILGCERTMQASNSRIQLTTIRAMQPRPRLMSALRVHATNGRDMTLAGCTVACAKANIRREGDGFRLRQPRLATGYRRRGPARTHPARAAPDAISASISVSPRPTSDKISRVCSPMPGAGPRIAEGVLPNSAAGVG